LCWKKYYEDLAKGQKPAWDCVLWERETSKK
jgi:hypothetical protein